MNKPKTISISKTYDADGHHYAGKLHTYGRNHQTEKPTECKFVIKQKAIKAVDKPPTWESDKVPYDQWEKAVAQAESRFFNCDTPVKATLF